ncbi:MAG: hypothetical protein QNK05_00510 [Myxococcota bacterium]|nr:hypothetical protein [Myxococcota bacterium]
MLRGALTRRSGLLGVLLISLSILAAPAGALDRGADGRFEKRESSHFVLYQDVDIDRSAGFHGSARFEREVLRVLEAAYGSLDRWLGLRPERKLPVYVYDPGIFDAQFAGLFKFGVAGFYAGAIRIRGDTAVTLQLSRTLHHELVHAALDAAAPSLPAPAWWNEGLAEWFEHRAHGSRRLSAREWGALGRAYQAGGWIPVAALQAPTFGHLHPETVPLAYLESRALVDLLERRVGADGLARTLDAWMRLRDLDRALRRTTRLDSASIESLLLGELN